MPNKPQLDQNLVMELETKFKCDHIVAELACYKANFVSLELALDYMYGQDLQMLHKHPFVPFQINAVDLDKYKKAVESETKGMDQANLNLELTSPALP